jgi:hypothetical protein
VKRDLGKPANAERGQSKFVLQAAELSFHGGAATVEIAEPLGVAWDERVAAVGLHPCGLGLAITRTPLGGPALEVGTREYPGAVRAGRGAMLAALDGGRLAEGHYREDAPFGALLVHTAHVVPAIHGARLRSEAASCQGVEQRGNLRGLVRPSRLDFPGKRKARSGADGEVQLEPEEPTPSPRAYGGAVAPGGIRVGEALPLGTAQIAPGDKATEVVATIKLRRVLLLQNGMSPERQDIAVARINSITEKKKAKAVWYAKLQSGIHPAHRIIGDPPEHGTNGKEAYVDLLSVTTIRESAILRRAGCLSEDEMRDISERLLRTLELDLSSYLARYAARQKKK